jgi:hypothetical protein
MTIQRAYTGRQGMGHLYLLIILCSIAHHLITRQPQFVRCSGQDAMHNILALTRSLLFLVIAGEDSKKRTGLLLPRGVMLELDDPVLDFL